jgi:hypothetical protein
MQVDESFHSKMDVKMVPTNDPKKIVNRCCLEHYYTGTLWESLYKEGRLRFFTQYADVIQLLLKDVQATEEEEKMIVEMEKLRTHGGADMVTAAMTLACPAGTKEETTASKLLLAQFTTLWNEQKEAEAAAEKHVNDPGHLLKAHHRFRQLCVMDQIMQMRGVFHANVPTLPRWITEMGMWPKA